MNSQLKKPLSTTRLDRLIQPLGLPSSFKLKQPDFLRLKSKNSSSLPTNQQKRTQTPSTRSIPAQTAVYSLTVAGTTYAGNTSFPSANTSYRPIENFRLGGTLVSEPTLAAQNSNRNGVNVREVGFFVGSASDYSSNRAGALRYGTHTYVHRFWGGRTLGRPALDTAFVSANTTDLVASVDPQWSRNDTSNTFAWRTSILSMPRQILQGQIQVRFTNGGRNVVGQAVFFGNGLIEPGAYAYTAQFSGTRVR